MKTEKTGKFLKTKGNLLKKLFGFGGLFQNEKDCFLNGAQDWT